MCGPSQNVVMMYIVKSPSSSSPVADGVYVLLSPNPGGIRNGNKKIVPEGRMTVPGSGTPAG